MSNKSITRANRNRVLEFERETKDRLVELGEIEKAILSVGQMRSRWLLGVSNIDEVESKSFSLKLDYLKAQSALAALNLQIDKVNLEGHYENQTLNYLVAATRPLDSGETKETRGKLLEQLARDNLEDLNTALRSSCDIRSKLSKEIHISTLELSKLRTNFDNRHASLVQELQDKISNYAIRMKEAVITSKKQHQKITGEYLVLRHNARTAKEVLLRSQNEAAAARKILQEKLDKMVEEATLQRERMEAGAAAELKIMTEDVRNSVIRKEGDANDLRRSIQAIETAQKRTAQSMKKSVKNDNKNYEILKNSRINEVNQWKEELSHLKGIIKRIELELEADEMKMKMKMNDTNNTEEYTIFQQLEDVQRHMLSIHAARV
jgi:hypothetical protein